MCFNPLKRVFFSAAKRRCFESSAMNCFNPLKRVFFSAAIERYSDQGHTPVSIR